MACFILLTMPQLTDSPMYQFLKEALASAQMCVREWNVTQLLTLFISLYVFFSLWALLHWFRPSSRLSLAVSLVIQTQPEQDTVWLQLIWSCWYESSLLSMQVSILHSNAVSQAERRWVQCPRRQHRHQCVPWRELQIIALSSSMQMLHFYLLMG